MGEWIRFVLDIILIIIAGTGLWQMMRLIRHLIELRKSRADMERFVREFHATVLRAEAGISNLKQTARDRGDDLEQLIDKGTMLRDELQFLVESADQLANRLAHTATQATRPASAATKPAPEQTIPPATASTPAPEAEKPSPKVASPMTVSAAMEQAIKNKGEPATRAERDLLQALQKLK